MNELGEVITFLLKTELKKFLIYNLNREKQKLIKLNRFVI